MNSISFILVLLFSLWTGILGFGQEIPPIQSYSPKEYGAENQNWALAQGPDQRVYIANNAGLMRFNGEQWELFPTPNQTILRSVQVVGKRIYTGCYREFGYWTENSFGQLVYFSISQKLKLPLAEDEQFWRILAQGQTIVFQSLNRLYLYDESTDQVKVIQAPSTLTKAYLVRGTLYFQVLGQGIFTLVEGKSRLFFSNELTRNEEIIELISRPQGDMGIITQNRGIWILSNGKLAPLTASQSVFSNTRIYSAMQLKNGNIALGTISHGLHILDAQGRSVVSLMQGQGISNNTILSLMEDQDESIWLGTDHGISIVNRQSSIQVFHDLDGRMGTVYAAQEKNGFLYLGSNQGLFVKLKNSSSDFQLIPGTAGQVWCLRKIGEDLFCGHHAGTFLIEGTKAQLISTLPGTWDIQPMPKQPNSLIQGTYKGLSRLKRENGRWKFQDEIRGLPVLSCRFIAWLNDRELFVNHEYKGVFKLTFSPDFGSILHATQEHTAPIGLKSGLSSFQGRVYYFCEQGVFRYEGKSGFVWHKELTDGLFMEDQFCSGRLIPDKDGQRMWAFTQQNVVAIAPNPMKKGFVFQRIALPYDVRQDRAGYENILGLEKDQFVLGTTDGYLVVSPETTPLKRSQLRLQSITKGNRTVVENEYLDLHQEGELNSEERTIRFRFYVPSFSKYNAVLYRYKLQGIYDTWTDWSPQSDVQFENLPPGQYTFVVMAKQHDEVAEEALSYTFTIASPWYATAWAKFFYALLGIGLLVSVNRVSRRYYQDQQKKALEKSQRAYERMKMASEQQVMQLQNQQLINEIESKNRELTLSTMSIIKKNEILHEIKRALQQVKQTKDAEQVAQLIDENLNDTKDWEFLEEAFNHADKDFLRKLKGNHPDLTPNDLRFCAYLRLNLSSKEIAPLLNISVRSVEIKRYRIRKKMDLPHEKSLVDYILSI